MILYFNVDDELIKEINSTSKSKGKEPTSVFIEWVSTKKGTDQKKAGALLSQTDILEKYIKKLPIVIFDRDREITTSEYDWLKKFSNVTLFEPTVLHRDGFKYLPHWTRIKKLEDIKLNENKRGINLGYIGDFTDKFESFKKYYLNTKSWMSDVESPIEVSYDTKISSESRDGVCEKYGVKKENLRFDNIDFTVIIGSYKDYLTGFLDPYYFKALENNCIPVVPKENRFYSSLPYSISYDAWFSEYYNMYEKTYIGLIKNIYENIEKYYPKMDIKYAEDTIKKYLGE